MKRIILLGLLLLLTLAGKYFILDRANVVKLPTGAVLSVVGTGLQDTSPGAYLPIEGKDYTVSKVTYFENQNWALVSTAPVGTASDPGLIVLKKIDNTYQKVLGPSSFFQDGDLNGLPDDLKNFLEQK